MVFISPNSVKSKYVFSEIHYAISKNKKILPVLLEKTDIPVGEDVVAISAATGAGMENLLHAIEKALGHSRHHVVVRLPYAMGGMVDTLHSTAQVKNVEYTAEGIEVETVIDPILYGRIRDYVIKEC